MITTGTPAAIPSDAPRAESPAALLATAPVLPLVSPVFYHRAARRGFGIAVFFLFVFATTVSALFTAGLVRGMGTAVDDIRRAFASGAVPEITIRSGIATVDAPQPVYIMNESRMLIAVDTTGRLTGIDRGRYDQGLLLTRTQVHFLNERGEYQRMNLTDLQTLFNRNPLLINAETTTRFWEGLTGILGIGGFVGSWVYNFVWRLVQILALAALLFALTKAMTNEATYGGVAAVGVYALVPMVYIAQLLARTQITFVFRDTLIWLAFWLFGLFAAYGSWVKPWQKLGGLRALAGIPLLLALAVDAVFAPANGAVILWVVFGVTVAVLVGISMFSGGEEEPAAPPPAFS